MPRDVNGNYSLPAGNPVVTATVISSTWANTTLSDLATAMTNSLDRTGASAGMTGQFKATSGSVGAPGIAFGSELTSGLYRAGAGDFRFAIAAADVLTISATNGLGIIRYRAGDGVIGNPAFSFTNETTSGLYRAAAGDFRFSISSTDIVKITATLITVPNLNVTSSTIPPNGIYASAANTIAIATNTTQRVTVDANGAVVINVPGAGIPLTVKNRAGTGTAASIVANDGNGQIIVAPADGAGAFALVLSVDGTGAKLATNSNSRDLQLQTNSTTALKITTAQLVQAIDQAGSFWDLGWRDLPPNFQGAAYTLVLADRGKAVVQQNVFAVNIPANSSVAFPQGTTICIMNISASPISITITTDTLTLAGSASTGTRTLAANGWATIFKSTGTSWLISGAGVT